MKSSGAFDPTQPLGRERLFVKDFFANGRTLLMRVHGEPARRAEPLVEAVRGLYPEVSVQAIRAPSYLQDLIDWKTAGCRELVRDVRRLQATGTGIDVWSVRPLSAAEALRVMARLRR